MNDQVREQFERWILSNGGSIDRTDGGEYRSAPTECAWSAWLANELTRTDQAAAKICCGQHETCDRPCTPRGRYLADKDARIGTYNEARAEPKEAPRMFPKKFKLNGNKLTLSLEFNGPIGVALIYSKSGELICACWPFVFRLTWGY